MAAIAQAKLFSGDALEARSDLDRFFLGRDHLPGERIEHYLEVMRRHRRDDFPLRAMWNLLLAGIVFNRASIESLLRELVRYPSLVEVCGFDPMPLQRKLAARVVSDPQTGATRIAPVAVGEPVCAIPESWNVSRFLANVIALEETLGMISEMLVVLRE